MLTSIINQSVTTMVQHDPQQQCFYLSVEPDQPVLAKLQYERQGQQVDFTHTYVNPHYRGQGHAETLVRHGLSWAKQQQLSIQASCWYVAKFLKDQ